jgi:lipoate-protein ligase A
MLLDHLPYRAAGAAENMAADFLLLKRAPVGRARFRHYGWRTPAFTFGYSQQIAYVRSQLPPGGSFDLCRRATGGGLVDHRDDWTYALVVTRGHPVEEMPASQSYRLVHEALAAALVAQGVPAVLKPVPVKVEPVDPNGLPAQSGAPAGVCFQRAEVFDVCHAATGEKMAGAAQKRAKQGMLFQGSIWRAAVRTDLDWDRFGENFAAGLATTLGASAVPAPWPDEIGDDALDALAEGYRAPEWMAFR